MIDTLVLYWQRGSGGDTVHRILSLDPRFIKITDEFELTEQGRSRPRINSWWLSTFPHDKYRWLARKWTVEDLCNLESRWPVGTDQTLILPTHRRDQALWLKNHIPGCRVLGICYPESLYFLVLQNWARKEGIFNDLVKQIYQDHWSTDCIDCLGPRLFKDQVRFGSDIANEVTAEWDINVNLGDLMIGRLDDLRCLGIVPESAAEIMDAWLPRQKKLYQYQWTVDPNLQAALGTNYLAPQAQDRTLVLDLYDKILLQHWCGNHGIPGSFNDWNSIQEAEVFFAAPQKARNKYLA